VLLGNAGGATRLFRICFYAEYRNIRKPESVYGLTCVLSDKDEEATAHCKRYLLYSGIPPFNHPSFLHILLMEDGSTAHDSPSLELKDKTAE